MGETLRLPVKIHTCHKTLIRFLDTKYLKKPQSWPRTCRILTFKTLNVLGQECIRTAFFPILSHLKFKTFARL